MVKIVIVLPLHCLPCCYHVLKAPGAIFRLPQTTSVLCGYKKTFKEKIIEFRIRKDIKLEVVTKSDDDFDIPF